ncbi:hypothetical protein BHM03_00015763 [Ensete ventricosum]|nr:hypothetical protein BHM03_00015763 [Ensete ventricosum]
MHAVYVYKLALRAILFIYVNIYEHWAGTVKENGVDAAGTDVLPTDGSEWVELFVREMMNASDVDDARTRVSRALEFLEKSIMAGADGEALRNLHKICSCVYRLPCRDLLCRGGVTIVLTCGWQINNYALTMHLRQAQQSSSIPGRFNPDVF